MPADKETACRMLADRWKTASHMRAEIPFLAEQLGGEFSENPFKFYEQDGIFMASRKLIRQAIVYPTIGVIPRGSIFRFNTEENREDVLILDGSVEAEIIEPPRVGQVNFTHYVSHLRRYGSFSAPADSDIILDARDDTYYFCRYTPQREPTKSP